MIGAVGILRISMNYVIRIIGIIACFIEIILFLMPTILFNTKKAKFQTLIMTMLGIICCIIAISCLVYNIILDN